MAEDTSATPQQAPADAAAPGPAAQRDAPVPAAESGPSAAAPVADAAPDEAESAGDEPAAAEGDLASSPPPEELQEEPVEALHAALAAAEDELKSAQDRALRAQAEADNTRRRAAREVENARKFAVERLAADMLPAIDSFERAIEAAAQASETTAAQGMELSLKLLTGALERAGLKVVDPAGEPFDPRFHEAMSMVENPDAEPGSVTQVVQKGWVLNERVVRAAMVMVAKAGAREGGETAAPEG